ncbi:MgtC/SapB family protein [Salisediminibacterium beveridgei]|uniref:Membrane protein, MgtC/SapB family n=1 Tax=Salisediminibacterium beveridgei TaxID=632773 RepID=A0A1D7R006_9BACI|nr:MgtC/SapB family protein [Salisediminibacterium beveridgei]AOM84596.1 Membrane protein, MgtC/SapB family [Salisediminibacterium beveridgei]
MDWTLIFSEDIEIMIIRLVMAALLGGLVGLEREYNHHPAGFRTHLLVSVGSCLMMLLAFYGFQDYIAANEGNVNFDPSRLAAYVVSGIGFLGAGTILVQGSSVKGLTTAASIWVVAGIGLTVGAGLYGPALIATSIVIVSLFILAKVNFRISGDEQQERVMIVADPSGNSLREIIEVFDEKHVAVKQFTSEKQRAYQEKMMIEYQLIVEYKQLSDLHEAMEKIQQSDLIHTVTVKF